jgi:mono/diheme cytochrome c family protein
MIEKYVNEEELKRLFSTLMVVLGALMIAALFASIIVPGLRNANKPEAAMPVNPVVGEPGWLDPTEFPAERGKVIPPLDPKTLISVTPDLMTKGQELFAQNCTPCHGERGRGDGPAASTMNPRPRNFTGSDGWKNGYDLPAIFKTLTEGIPSTSMAPFDYLSKRNRMALAHYVQSLGSFPHGDSSREATDALSKTLAAAGEKTPNKIPVSAAMAKLVQEYQASAPLAGAPDGQGAEWLQRLVLDPARAAETLTGSSVWRSGPKELAASILPGVPGNGFSTAAAALSAEEWKALLAELLKSVQYSDKIKIPGPDRAK